MNTDNTPPIKLHGDNHPALASPRIVSEVKDELPPFNLDAHIIANGHRPLAPGEQWHRTDWTAEMLPAGTRPLLLKEVDCAGDEIDRCEGWEVIDDEGGRIATESYTLHCRTTRLLPPFPAPATEEKSLGEIAHDAEQLCLTAEVVTHFPIPWDELSKMERRVKQESAEAVASAVSTPLKAEIERLKGENYDLSVKNKNQKNYLEEVGRIFGVETESFTRIRVLCEAAKQLAEAAEARNKELEWQLASATQGWNASTKAWGEVHGILPDNLAPDSLKNQVITHIQDLRAQLATAQDDERKACVERVRDALESYRCHHSIYDGDGSQLIDVLSAGEDSTVASGKEELELLADHIASAIITPTIKESAPEKEEKTFTGPDGAIYNRYEATDTWNYPCDGERDVIIICEDGRVRGSRTANGWTWLKLGGGDTIIGWRYADTPPAQVPPVSHEACHERNRNIRDSVDALLEQAGFHSECSIRNQLSWMNFDPQPGQFDSKNA